MIKIYTVYQLGIVMHALNPSTGRWRQSECQSSRGYIVRLLSQTNKVNRVYTESSKN